LAYRVEAVTVAVVEENMAIAIAVAAFFTCLGPSLCFGGLWNSLWNSL
jgi:hypothetical protein